MIRCDKNLLNVYSLKLLYYAQIQNLKAITLRGNMGGKSQINKKQKLQNKCTRLITGQVKYEH